MSLIFLQGTGYFCIEESHTHGNLINGDDVRTKQTDIEQGHKTISYLDVLFFEMQLLYSINILMLVIFYENECLIM